MTDRNLLEKNTNCQRPESASNLYSEAMVLCQKQSNSRNSPNEDHRAELQQKDKADDFLPSLSIGKNDSNFCPAYPLLKDKFKLAEKDKPLPPLVIINTEVKDSHIPTKAEIHTAEILSSNKFDGHEALKQAWAQLPKHNRDYDSLHINKEGQVEIGRYGLSAEQIDNFLAVLNSSASSKTLEKLSKEHILTKTMETNLENPQFRQEMKDFVKMLENGSSQSHEQFKKYFPRQVQEAIASFHVEKMQEIVGKKPGTVIAALDKGQSADSVESSFKQEPSTSKAIADKLFHANIERQETILNKAEEEQFKNLPNRIPETERRPLLEKALRLAGVSPTESNIAALQVMVQEESGWDPQATNDWDINARIFKTPSQGLIQTIPETFQRYAIPDYDSDITDPASNLIAGIRYTISKNGSLQRTPGIVARSQDEKYKGY